MLSWWTKNWPHPINVWDTVTNVVPLCSQTASMVTARVGLFEDAIYPWVQTTSRINSILKYVHCVGNWASNVRLGSYYGDWITEHNGTTIVTVCHVLVEWGQFFVHRDNIWQSLPLCSTSQINKLQDSLIVWCRGGGWAIFISQHRCANFLIGSSKQTQHLELPNRQFIMSLPHFEPLVCWKVQQ